MEVHFVELWTRTERRELRLYKPWGFVVVLIHPDPPFASRLHHLPLLCRNKPQTVTGHVPPPSSGPHYQMRYGGVAISQSFFPGLDHALPSVERIGTACDKDFSACASLIADSVEDDDVCNKTPRRPSAGSASSRVSSAGIQYGSEGEKGKGVRDIPAP